MLIHSGIPVSWYVIKKISKVKEAVYHNDLQNPSSIDTKEAGSLSLLLFYALY